MKRNLLERKLYRKINSFIKKFNPTVRLSVEEEMFCYEHKSNTIILDFNEIIYEPFDEKIELAIHKENGLIFDISAPTFAILHELGHSILHNKGISESYQLSVAMLSLIDDDYVRNRSYKEIKEEKEADQFAYNLYLHNYELIKNFDKEIMDLIFN